MRRAGGVARTGRFGTDALRANIDRIRKGNATHFAVRAESESETIATSACGHPVDVAFSTADPLEVTCSYCKRASAWKDARLPIVLTEQGKGESQ